MDKVAKLSPEHVVEIRNSTESNNALAQRFPVTAGHIYDVKRRRRRHGIGILQRAEA